MLSHYLNKKRQLGVTLVEMLITIAIVSILVGVVAPSINTIMTKNNITADINELSGLFQLARFTAIDEQSSVVICPSADFSSCSSSWEDPKIAFIDSNSNDTMDVGESLLAATEAMSSNTMTSNRALIRFLDSGASSFDANQDANEITSIIICPDDGDVKFARGLFVTPQGRVRLSQDANDNGIHQNILGAALTCS